MMVRGVPWSTGDGIKMAQKAGATLVNMGGMATVHAAGECVGGIFYDDYWGGGSLARCVVLGRVAGKNAAAKKVMRKKTS